MCCCAVLAVVQGHEALAAALLLCRLHVFAQLLPCADLAKWRLQLLLTLLENGL